VRAVMPICAMCAALRRGEASSGRPMKDDMVGNFMVGVAGGDSEGWMSAQDEVVDAPLSAGTMFTGRKQCGRF
jgi:hypothetical protein